jgi:hypothetical protein
VIPTPAQRSLTAAYLLLGGGGVSGKIGFTLGGGLSISEPGVVLAGAAGAATTFLLFLAAAKDGGVAAKAIAPRTPRMSGSFTTNLFMSSSSLVFCGFHPKALAPFWKDGPEAAQFILLCTPP